MRTKIALTLLLSLAAMSFGLRVKAEDPTIAENTVEIQIEPTITIEEAPATDEASVSAEEDDSENWDLDDDDSWLEDDADDLVPATQE